MVSSTRLTPGAVKCCSSLLESYVEHKRVWNDEPRFSFAIAAEMGVWFEIVQYFSMKSTMSRTDVLAGTEKGFTECLG
jgi:hypothetical protein